MPTPIPHPELDTCLLVVGEITSAAIKSGQLSSDIDEVTTYFAELYPRISQLRQQAAKS